MSNQAELIYKAKIAEQTERFDDMVMFMRQLIETQQELTEEHRNLISIAYKNSVSQKRTAWRAISQFLLKQQQNVNYKSVTEFYKNHLENEMKTQCEEIIKILDDKILPKVINETKIPESKQTENTVFFMKMKADYYRYLCEFIQNEEQKEYKIKAQELYQEAYELTDQLAKYNTIRLGLALNYSVFHYEINNELEQAIKIASKAHEDALLEIENFEDEQMKDATTVMQLLKDNQTNWQHELEEENKNENTQY